MPIGSSKLGVLGAGLVPGGTETFNASGTWDVPPGVKTVSITGVGGTGNPGNCGTAGNPGNPGTGAGGGGGGGACSGPNCSPNVNPITKGGGAGGSAAPGGGTGGAGGTGNPVTGPPGLPGVGNPGAAGNGGNAGTGGSAGCVGNLGNTGCSSIALGQTFCGGAGGNAGAVGNAENAGTGGSGANGGTGRPLGPQLNTDPTYNSPVANGNGGNGGGNGLGGFGEDGNANYTSPEGINLPGQGAGWLSNNFPPTALPCSPGPRTTFRVLTISALGRGGGGGAGDVNSGGGGANPGNCLSTRSYTRYGIPPSVNPDFNSNVNQPRPWSGWSPAYTPPSCAVNSLAIMPTRGNAGNPGGGRGGYGAVQIDGKYLGNIPSGTIKQLPPAGPQTLSASGGCAGTNARAGGGGGGSGSARGSGVPSKQQSAGSGGGGGRGNAGNCGGLGNPGNPGNSGCNATHNCVPVIPGGSYPIVVGGPSGGSVVINWNPQ